MNASNLLPIIAYARSGALDYAWRLFRQAGLEGVDDDPAVLSVRGRLLKDRALASHGADRRRFYQEAARAYGRAAILGGATYPLINAATLWLLAGQGQDARDLARRVLERGEGDEDETPYYRVATRAEAMLLLGDEAGAGKALRDAVARAPRAWEDHASTLRQFGLILKALGRDDGWLGAFRPPRALHFGGHMQLDPDDASTPARIRSVLEQENIGSGFGALAAGADILAAEALLERQAELHLILPGDPASFRRTSVGRFGDAWLERFDRLLEAADSVRVVDGGAAGASALAIQLAAEVAMGAAAMRADALMTEAVQLLILDRGDAGPREPGGSDWMGERWGASGRRRLVLEAARVRAAPRAPAGPAPIDESAELTAMLRIDFGSAHEADRLEALSRLAEALRRRPAGLAAPRWNGDAVLAPFGSPAEAAQAALSAAALGTPDVRVAGGYGVMTRKDDPFGGVPLFLGPMGDTLRSMSASVPPGAIHVTDDFAAALSAGPAKDRPRLEYVGELPTDDPGAPLGLYALKP